MDKYRVLIALSALAQETRLDIFRYLVEVGPSGVPAGQIGERLNVPWATHSFHLKTLQHAGVLERKRQSRSIIYSANFATMNGVVAYLTENCCGGQPEACALPTWEQSDTNDTAQQTTSKQKRGNER